MFSGKSLHSVSERKIKNTDEKCRSTGNYAKRYHDVCYSHRTTGTWGRIRISNDSMDDHCQRPYERCQQRKSYLPGPCQRTGRYTAIELALIPNGVGEHSVSLPLIGLVEHPIVTMLAHNPNESRPNCR
jgi:hypothetical protein